MNMKHYMVLAAIVVVGLWGNSQLKLSLPTNIRYAKFDMKGFDVKPYQRSNLENDRDAQAFMAKTKAYRLAKAGTFKPTEIGGRATITPATLPAAKVVAKKDPKKEAADKKKKKAALAKKKKEKEKLNRRGGVINDYEQDNSYANRSSDSDRTPSLNSSNESSGSYVVDGGAAAAAQAKKDKESKDLEDWKKLLLSFPSRENTIDFIRAYQKNEISEETFYTVITAMYTEGGQEFQSLAVLAAGSVSNIKSFDFLISVLSDQSQGSTVAANSERELHEYTSISSIFVVRQVFTSRYEDEQKVFYAAQAIDNSTETYLTANSNNPSAPVVQLSSVQKQIFASFVPALEKILDLYANNSQIADPGKRALERIKTIAPVVAQNQFPVQN
ncbi:MAG: hypothetical protein AABZ31_10015 [Bdellovibrionota bacterium]